MRTFRKASRTARSVREFARGLADTDHPLLVHLVPIRRCNIDCGYCNEYDKVSKPVPTDQMLARIDKLAELGTSVVAFSGGEPMLQRPFVTRIFRRCKALGIHTCMDTSGRLGDKMTDEDLMDIDLNILDIKSGDPEIYKKVTRQPLQPTLDYAQRLSRLGRPMWVRYVLVPGLTDGYDNVQKVADFVAGLKTVERIEILRAPTAETGAG